MGFLYECRLEEINIRSTNTSKDLIRHEEIWIMEHSWILIVAMIGHVLCVYSDRLILCTPGGNFGNSDIKDKPAWFLAYLSFAIGTRNHW